MLHYWSYVSLWELSYPMRDTSTIRVVLHCRSYVTLLELWYPIGAILPYGSLLPVGVMIPCTVGVVLLGHRVGVVLPYEN